MERRTILSVKDFSVSFTQYAKGLSRRVITPVSSLDYTVKEGEVHAIIGESGSGKSLLAHAVLGILPCNSFCKGQMEYKGKPLTEKKKILLRGREIAFIPQSVNYLDPLMRVGKVIAIGLERKSARTKTLQLMKRYGLEEKDALKYPHELSGGMLRRVLFATSVRDGINLVIADEPTPGIHPEALCAILNQLRMFADNGAAVMLITHDILSALTISDRVTVLKEGVAIETTDVASFSGDGSKLRHPYTRALWKSLPCNGFMTIMEEHGWD